MSYIVVEDFKFGMDRRRARSSGAPGALWLGKNVHITRGGDIERRKKFVEHATLPAGTFDLAGVSGQLFVFGSQAAPTMPPEVVYQRLEHPDGEDMSDIRGWTTFDGMLYASAEYADGSAYHFYDGARVEDWDALSENIGSLAYVAFALAQKIDREAAYTATAVGNVVKITAAVPGTGYTIAKATANGAGVNDQDITLTEIQANVAEVLDARATGTVTITGGSFDSGVNQIVSVTVNGVTVTAGAVDWETSNSATAAALAASINSHTSVPDYTATAVGATVTIRAAAGTGSGPNGFVVVANVAGDVTASTTNMSGGQTAVSPLAQVYEAELSGTFEVDDLFTITLDGDDYSVAGGAPGTGGTVLTFDNKVYSTVTRLLAFSGLNGPHVWDSGNPDAGTYPGFGTINMANQNDGYEQLTALAEYQGKLAIFSDSAVRIWSVDANPDNNRKDNNVPNTGTRAPRSVRAYGNLDVFYLDNTGVRSLRARDSSNAPAVNDIGVPLDPFIQEYMATLTERQIQRACSVIEPVDGRFWLALGNRIFVLSSFAGAKINAWSYYDLSDEIEGDIEAMIRVGKRTYLRSGDKIYLYGGPSGDEYPEDGEIEADVILPFLSAKTPGTMKQLKSLDFNLSGEWAVYLLPDASRPEVELLQGVFFKPTAIEPTNASLGRSSSFGLRLRCNKAGAAGISTIIVHYTPGEAS